MSEEIARVTISMSADLHKRLFIEAAKQQIKTGKKVSISSLATAGMEKVLEELAEGAEAPQERERAKMKPRANANASAEADALMIGGMSADEAAKKTGASKSNLYKRRRKLVADGKLEPLSQSK